MDQGDNISMHPRRAEWIRRFLRQVTRAHGVQNSTSGVCVCVCVYDIAWTLTLFNLTVSKFQQRRGDAVHPEERCASMFQPLNEHVIFGMTASKFRRRWEEGVEGEDEREVILKDLNSHLVPEHKVFSTVNVDPIMHNTKCRSRCCEYGRDSLAT